MIPYSIYSIKLLFILIYGVKKISNSHNKISIDNEMIFRKASKDVEETALFDRTAS